MCHEMIQVVAAEMPQTAFIGLRHRMRMSQHRPRCCFLDVTVPEVKTLQVIKVCTRMVHSLLSSIAGDDQRSQQREVGVNTVELEL